MSCRLLCWRFLSRAAPSLCQTPCVHPTSMGAVQYESLGTLSAFPEEREALIP